MSGARRGVPGAPGALGALGLAVAVVATPPPAAAEAMTFTFDPAHTFVHFEIDHFATSTTRGRFGPVQGALVLDRAARRGEVGVRIATRGVDTGLAVFDARLRRADLLAVDDWPEAFFVARDFRFDGDALTAVRGEFTLRGVSQPLTLQARLFACRREADSGATVCGGDFEAEIRRSDFGITFGLPFVADRVRLVVQVEARSP